MTHTNTYQETIGIDLGDRFSHLCVLDAAGEVIKRPRIRTTLEAMVRYFGRIEKCRVVLEVGGHSPWVSRLLAEMGHEVIVANPRQLKLIFKDARKNDRRDAELLARLGRTDPKLLHPIRHRGVEAQCHRALLKSRDILVQQRSSLVTHARSIVKSIGHRLPSCSPECFPRKVRSEIPSELREALLPILDEIQAKTERIEEMNRRIEQISREYYPQTQLFRQVNGVGPLTALGYALTVEDPTRFQKSREVGPYLGLVPKRDQSGGSDPSLRITKTGDPYMRRLLVNAAQHILGPFGEDSDLRRFGLRICERGGKNAKKRAVVAVARKLAVLLHRLWITGEVYEPLYNSEPKVAAA